MANFFKKMSNLVSFLFIFSIISANDCYNNVKITENFFNDDILGYYLSAIDFDSGQSNVLLFDLSIDFSDAISSYLCSDIEFADECTLSPSTCCDSFPGACDSHNINELYVDFKIEVFIPQFQSFSDGLTTLVDGTVLLSNIQNHTHEINIRNTDINFDTQSLQDGATFDLLSHNIHIDDNDINNMSETFLSLGRIPNGTYSFTFTLKDDSQTIIDGAIYNKTIDIFMPTYLNLLYPGSSAISDSSINVVSTTNPVFQWDADYCSNCDLSIRVCEYNPAEHLSFSEAIEDYSVLPIESGYFPVNSNINMFQYPLSDVINLINGKLYVWQLKRSYLTTNGNVNEFSDIFIFKIQSLDYEDEFQLSSDENLYNLKLFIGEERYNELFGPDGNLNNFNNIDPVIIVNNQEMPIVYLIDLINKLNNDEINILEVNVE